MPVAPGTRVGAYEVVSLLGAGGMGEVYRARDAKLGRDVALKILPDSLAADRDRLMRFEREARTLGSLNHPNIAQVFGLEDTSGTRAIVMELIEGEDLAAHIERGPLSVDEALIIARQIAAALEAAHDAGVVHRDLKPANIKLRPDGTVKVLDFGLAKALDPAAAQSGVFQTVTSPALTMGGVILGTATYMSPEQARGRPVDRRADVWAFGCVLFEMLTGTRAFGGSDTSEVIARIIQSEPDWAALPPTTPTSVRGVLHRCLQKDPSRRFHHVADARLELEVASDRSDAMAPATAGSPAECPPMAALDRWRTGSRQCCGAGWLGTQGRAPRGAADRSLHADAVGSRAIELDTASHRGGARWQPDRVRRRQRSFRPRSRSTGGKADLAGRKRDFLLG